MDDSSPDNSLRVDSQMGLPFDITKSLSTEDEELARLNNQIINYEKLVQVLEQQIDQRRERYVNTLNKIKLQIQKENSQSEINFLRQLENQDSEYNALKEAYHQQMEQLNELPRRAEKDIDSWVRIHQEIVDVETDLEAVDLRNELDKVQKDIIATTIENGSNKLSSEFYKNLEFYALQIHLKNLETDINRLRNDIKTQRNSYQTVIQEIEISSNMKDQFYDATRNHINKEMTKRDKFFTKHMSLINQIVDKEKRKYDYDVKYYQSQINSLQTAKRETVRRCSTLLDKLSTDIERMQITLKKAEENDLKDLSYSINSIGQIGSYMKNQASLKQTEINLENELERIKSQNRQAIDTLKNLMMNDGRFHSVY